MEELVDVIGGLALLGMFIYGLVVLVGADTSQEVFKGIALVGITMAIIK